VHTSHTPQRTFELELASKRPRSTVAHLRTRGVSDVCVRLHMHSLHTQRMHARVYACTPPPPPPPPPSPPPPPPLPQILQFLDTGVVDVEQRRQRLGVSFGHLRAFVHSHARAHTHTQHTALVPRSHAHAQHRASAPPALRRRAPVRAHQRRR
jgi:hypothetical protein